MNKNRIEVIQGDITKSEVDAPGSLKSPPVDPFQLPLSHSPGRRVLTLPPPHAPGLPGPQPGPKSRQERKRRRGQVGWLHEGLA